MAVSCLAGKYELIRKIGKGGMGEVHLARLVAPREVRKLVALKMALDADAGSQATLFDEARLAALIVHPNVVQLFDAGMEGTLAWFTMEYVPGPSLAELLALPRREIPAWTWARIFADVCAALHAVHEARDEQGVPLQVVHRDITPQNLLVGWNGVCKLVDFGIARSALRNAPTTTGVVRGKLGYMSPEQAGGESIDRRSDIFAVGVLMWEALAGRRLFARANESETLASILRGDVPPLRDVAPDVPPALAALVERALLRERAARFSTALEMQQALERALCENQVVISANEVAHVLSTLPIPRELADTQTSSGAPAVIANARAKPRAAGAPRGLAQTWRPLAYVLGISLGATGIGALLRSRSAASEEHDRAPLSTAALESRHHSAETDSPLSASVLGAPNPASAPTQSQLEAAPVASNGALGAPEGPEPSNEVKSKVLVRSKGASTSSRAVAPAPSGLRDARPGTLNVSARPIWAAISVDGQPRGSTPLVIQDLSPGTHVIEAAPLGKPPLVRQVVVVRPDVVQRVEFQLERRDP